MGRWYLCYFLHRHLSFRCGACWPYPSPSGVSSYTCGCGMPTLREQHGGMSPVCICAVHTLRTAHTVRLRWMRGGESHVSHVFSPGGSPLHGLCSGELGWPVCVVPLDVRA